MLENKININFITNELREIWHQFCEMHTVLYEHTCNEYMHLLSSDIESLEETIQIKNITIKQIHSLELQRQELANSIASFYKCEPPQKIKDLIETLKHNNQQNIAVEIEKMNLILLDVIDKIQEQNKKNQFFLNKAIISLNELKENFIGKTNLNTYCANGRTKTSPLY